jgi:hypothetical protein
MRRPTSERGRTRKEPDGSHVTFRTTLLWPWRTDILTVSSMSMTLIAASLIGCNEDDVTRDGHATHSDETAIRFPAGSTTTQRMHAAAELVTTASISGSPALYCRTSESLLPENHALFCSWCQRNMREKRGKRTLAANVIIDSPASIAVGGS